ncbi:DNA polymerase III, subunit delta' [Gottschalkia acidurici 9a]|uniref:DNA polymerase III subunit delta' n=1 Tax=Gottschalkia acidurici (strain ATCC 7906 / DSM 604 / BCRC 14475 / CIP 104303 / KCTC 5404 / NCIMB 10678 / 9a) TaxID=1128398 RepID=K0AV97_GOTA9|nr:DNA polymerase III subunit delta' C-terminal domain-containing protein [Gottschalkia acidurici]AFS77194.1 DNA polymerase III, subunit delta' [Gottschalkia acidurici 9a]
MDFNDVIGHEKIISNLKNTIRNDHVAHSYLFEGSKLIGKETLGKVFAKTLLCEKRSVEPCNICQSCIQFDKTNHPDFKIIYPDGQSFKKDQAEEIQRDIRIKPFNSYRKVYILKDIEKMTIEAQNSFLKTLEEPPEYAVIIMTTVNKYKLVPTILSRCQTINFTLVESSKIEKSLVERLKKSDAEAKFLSLFSNGIVGKAIALSESEDFKKIREELITAIDTTLNEDRTKVFSTSEFFQENKDDIEDILDMILLWFRDILIYKESNNENYLVNKDKVHTIINHSKNLNIEKIHDIIETVINTKESIDSKVNFGLAIEMMLLQIQEV